VRGRVASVQRDGAQRGWTLPAPPAPLAAAAGEADWPHPPPSATAVPARLLTPTCMRLLRVVAAQSRPKTRTVGHVTGRASSKEGGEQERNSEPLAFYRGKNRPCGHVPLMKNTASDRCVRSREQMCRLTIESSLSEQM